MIPRILMLPAVHVRDSGESERSLQEPKKSPLDLEMLSFAPLPFWYVDRQSSNTAKSVSEDAPTVVSSAYWITFSRSTDAGKGRQEKVDE